VIWHLFDLKKHLQCDAMPRRVAVAWSGGADSTALLLLLKKAGFDVVAWHVDHGWHSESCTQANDLRKQAQGWGIPFFLVTLNKPLRSLEAESRNMRYDAFAKLAKQQRRFHLALGHHADDQAETVCMRLLQGSGVAGCQGMRLHRQQGELHLWRPMLGISRLHIEQYLCEQGVAWLQDPSNFDCLLWRNKIRHQLFPKIQAYGENPQRLFLRIQKQAKRVQAEIEALAKHIHIRCKDSDNKGKDNRGCSVSWASWCMQSEVVRVYVLQKMIGILFANSKVFGRKHFTAIEQWKKHGAHGWVSLSGCYLQKQGDQLWLFKGYKGAEKYNSHQRIEVKS